jgi:type II secretory pathway pseudopilin PulG
MEQSKGFSLIELLMSLTIAFVLTMIVFQLFHLSERAARDQALVMEMQQTARVVGPQIADEIRMAGQGVPLFAASFDPAPSEAATVILGSSSPNRIDFRAGLSNVETAVSSPGPLDLAVGVSRILSIEDGTGFASGKYVYVYGPGSNSAWVWVRAELTRASPASLTLTPRQTGGSDTLVHFIAAPTVSLEEAVSIFLTAGSVRRATAGNMTDPANPNWGTANEIGNGFSALTFTYYDALGNAVVPNSLALRSAIARVDINLTVVAAGRLTDGSQPQYSLAMRTIPRNLRLHAAN